MTFISRPLRILYIAYPLLPVSENSCGGAEQILITVEREMARRGHQTAVAACAGSRVAGELLATGSPPLRSDNFEERSGEHNRKILAYLANHGDEFDLIHDKSGTFWQSLDRNTDLPASMLVTLHLGRSFYRAEAFEQVPHKVFFNCVSETQAMWFRDLGAATVRNGIDLKKFPFRAEKGDYLLWLGRICEEKGAHLAIEVARRTGLPLVIAGQVYPFSYHQNYFRQEILPHLDGEQVRWEESPTIEVKLQLLERASALLIPTLVDETSSLVAMEAMACGTPVVAFRRGAMHEVVSQGSTGFLVDSVDQMVEAVENLRCIDPDVCRHCIEEQYSAVRMTDGYEALYQRMVVRVQSQAVGLGVTGSPTGLRSPA